MHNQAIIVVALLFVFSSTLHSKTVQHNLSPVLDEKKGRTEVKKKATDPFTKQTALFNSEPVGLSASNFTECGSPINNKPNSVVQLKRMLIRPSFNSNFKIQPAKQTEEKAECSILITDNQNQVLGQLSACSLTVGTDGKKHVNQGSTLLSGQTLNLPNLKTDKLYTYLGKNKFIEASCRSQKSKNSSTNSHEDALPEQVAYEKITTGLCTSVPYGTQTENTEIASAAHSQFQEEIEVSDKDVISPLPSSDKKTNSKKSSKISEETNMGSIDPNSDTKLPHSNEAEKSGMGDIDP